MSAVATAIVGGALISANSASHAADSQRQAAQQATDLQYSMFNTQNNQNAPWRQAGETALNQLTAGTADGGQFTHQFNAADLNSNLAPNYEFQKAQGLGATQNQINAGGGLLSGNALQGINTFAQNYAGNAYQQAFNNYNTQQSNIFNRLSNIAGLGQGANQITGAASSNASNGISQSIQGAGNAQAAGQIGVGNAISGGIGQGLSYNYLNNLTNGGGGGTDNFSYDPNATTNFNQNGTSNYVAPSTGSSIGDFGSAALS